MKTVKGIRRVAVKTRGVIDKEIKKLNGVSRVRGGVVFTAFYPSASAVGVAGDFNGWQPQLAPMKKKNKKGDWQIKLPLTPGSYRYRFVVDGQWQHDPHNPDTEPNPYGELNSVLKVNK
jgi:1,4-alpha-glucan branching enzyme